MVTVGGVPEDPRESRIAVATMATVKSDVIVISDTEEGELVEPEECVHPEDEREEGELEDDDVHPCVPVSTSTENLAKRNPLPVNNSFVIKKYNPPEYGYRHFNRRSFITKKKTHFIGSILPRSRRAYSKSRFVITPQGKTRRKHYKEVSSDSEYEEITKKNNVITVPGKVNKTSLQSRLSNMLKYSGMKGTRRTRMNSDVDKENGQSKRTLSIDNSDSKDTREDGMSDDDVDALRELALKSKSERMEKSSQGSLDDADVLRELALQSKGPRVPKIAQEKPEDIDVLRAVALQSKTRRLSKTPQCDNEEMDIFQELTLDSETQPDEEEVLRQLALKSKTRKTEKGETINVNNAENAITKSNEEPDKNYSGGNGEKTNNVDKEIEELRLVALKSAVIHKAMKRKRKKEDKVKEKRQKLIDYDKNLCDLIVNRISSPLVSPKECSGNIMYDYEYYNCPFKESESNMTNRSQLNDKKDDSKVKNIISDNASSTLLSVDENQDISDVRSSTPLSSTHNMKTLPEKRLSSDFTSDINSNLVIKLGESDSDSECETTKNLLVMHKKLNRTDSNFNFQNNLDVFLKGVRQTALEKENTNIKNKKITKTNKTSSIQQKGMEKIPKKTASVQVKNTVVAAIQKNQPNIQSKGSLIEGKKDNKQILRPSLLVNRKSSFSDNGETPSVNDRGRKVLEDHLITLRKRISIQTVSVKQVKNEVNSLQEKKLAIMTQLRTLNFILKNTENSINLSQRSLQVELNKLTSLQKQHVLLQSRYTKLTPRKMTALKLNAKIKIVEKNISQQTAKKEDIGNKKIIQNEPNESKNPKKDIDKESIGNVNGTKEIVVKRNGVVKNQCSSILNSNKVKEVSVNENTPSTDIILDKNYIKVDSSETVENIVDIVNVDNFKDYVVTDNCKDLNKLNSIFVDYKTPLLAMKSKESWIPNPEAIWCPFQVGGHCKDTSCNYFHLKT